jgi:enoyl-CoA hydratase/carnithine racemase
MGGSTPVILYEKKGAVANITINRPEKRNCLNRQVFVEMLAALRDAEKDRNIKVITTTGSGDIAWSAGFDFDYLHSMFGGDVLIPDELGLEADELIRNIPKVTMAVVNGFALGGAFTVLTAHDLIIASDKAQIGQPEIFRGFPARYAIAAAFWHLPSKVAMEVVLTGRNLSAAEAHTYGLVNRVVPHAELRKAAQAWAEEIGQYDLMTLAYSKKAGYDSLDCPTYLQAIRHNIMIQDLHGKANPNVAKGLEEMRAASAKRRSSKGG